MLIVNIFLIYICVYEFIFVLTIGFTEEAKELNINLDGFKDIGNLAEVNNLNYHFGEYKLVQLDSPWKDNDLVAINREWCLVGVGVQKDKGIEHRFSKPEVLISLVNLADKILNGYGLYDQKGDSDELAFYQDIVSWCRKYGLPYEEDYLRKQDYKTNQMGFTCAFRLWEFKRRISVLYNAFQLWYGLAFDDSERIIKFAHSAVTRIQAGKSLDSQLPLIKELFSYRIWADMHTEIRLKYNKNTDNFEIEPYTNSLVSVAYFQLAMLMTNNGIKSVRFCSVCNGLFEIEHGSTKICDKCKSEYHRIKTRESRQRKNQNTKTNQKPASR